MMRTELMYCDIFLLEKTRMEIQAEFDRNEVTKEKQRDTILCQYETSRFNLTIYFQPVPPLEQGTQEHV